MKKLLMSGVFLLVVVSSINNVDFAGEIDYPVPCQVEVNVSQS